MSLSPKLLEKLVCPNCKKSLEYKQELDKLICNECRVAYRVNNDVPVLLPDEAEKI